MFNEDYLLQFAREKYPMKMNESQIEDTTCRCTYLMFLYCNKQVHLDKSKRTMEETNQ